MIQKYFSHNKANYNSKETKITSMTKKSHRAPACAELGPAQPQLVSISIKTMRPAGLSLAFTKITSYFILLYCSPSSKWCKELTSNCDLFQSQLLACPMRVRSSHIDWCLKHLITKHCGWITCETKCQSHQFNALGT